MDGKKGGLAVESLVLLVTILFTSAAVFYLVQSGVVGVEGVSNGTGAASLQEQFLNVEFLPISQGGTLAIQEFSLCYSDDVNSENLLCDRGRELFFPGDEVHFSFKVISSSRSGQIELLENYKLIDPYGEVLLDVNSRDDYEYVAESDESVELVHFHDFFYLYDDDPTGTYTLELVMRNELIGKEVVLREEIIVK